MERERRGAVLGPSANLPLKKTVCVFLSLSGRAGFGKSSFHSRKGTFVVILYRVCPRRELKQLLARGSAIEVF